MLRAFLIIFISIVFSTSSRAYRPIAHIILQRTITQRLPEDNIFKIAMNKYPSFAAWGAVGPDLGYIPVFKRKTINRRFASSINNANMWHYSRTAKFCSELINTALASKDTALIAFAAGWLTHAAGDFESHGIFVGPWAGYYIDSVGGRSFHGEMEQYAETIIFCEQGKKLADTGSFYTDANLNSGKIFSYFFDIPYGQNEYRLKLRTVKEKYDKIGSCLASLMQKVYGESISVHCNEMMANYDMAFGTDLGKRSIKSELSNYPEALAFLANTPGMRKALNQSFNNAVEWGTEMLQTCANTPCAFSGKWNFDVGRDARTLIVTTKIGENAYSGSYHPLQLTISQQERVLYTGRLSYKVYDTLDFRYRSGDLLYSYVYLDPHKFPPGEYDLEVKRERFFNIKLADQTIIDRITFEDDGDQVFEIKEKIKLNRHHNTSKKYKITL